MTLEERLENWGDCMRRRRTPQTVDSKERDWRSPQGNHWNPPGAPVQPVSVDERAARMIDAQEMDRVISGLPQAHRMVLRAEYVGLLALDQMLRIARTYGGFKVPTKDDVRAMLHLARCMLERRLSMPAVFRQPRERDRALPKRNNSDMETESY